MGSPKEKHIYRIDIIENDTHKTVRSLKVSKFGGWAIAVSSLVFVVAVVYCVVAFTPLRDTIPGYPDAHTRQAAVENAIKIDSLEARVLRWELYAGNLSRVLRGEQTVTLDSLVSGSAAKYLSDASREELALRDSTLRSEIIAEDRFTLEQDIRKVLPIEGMLFFPPLKGGVSAPFKPGTHPCTDISAPKGSTVKAALDGTVVATAWDELDAWSVTMQHSGNIVSIIRHCESVLVKAGDKVTAGTAVAILGGGGAETVNHLSFELWYNGEATDPAQYISF